MRKEHTISEVTNTEGVTDAQFFYGEIKKLQSECDKLKLLNNKLLEDNHKLEDRLSDAKDIIIESDHLVRDIKSCLSDYSAGKLTKAIIISRIEGALKNLDIVRINNARKELEKWL